MKNGFGLAYIKAEGAPIHPDDCNSDTWPDEVYIKQLEAYDKWHKTNTKENCIRNYLFKKYKDDKI